MAFTDRYQTFRAYIDLEGNEFITPISLNPFQIESFYQIRQVYRDSSGEDHDESAFLVRTKSGNEHVILSEADEFISALNSSVS